MATTPNYGWVMPDPTDFVTDLPADFEIFGDAVDTTLEAIETKLDVITTEGDLVVGDASGDPVRLPIGALGTVLTSDGDTAEWVSASAGGLSLITTQDMAGIGTVTFSSIPQTYKYLIVQGSNLSRTGFASTIKMRFNGYSGSTYDRTALSSTTASNTNQVNQDHWQITLTGSVSTNKSAFFITIANYTDLEGQKGWYGYITRPDGQNNWLAIAHADDVKDEVDEITIFIDSPATFTTGQITLYGGN
jgi:hypothetical protein